MNNLVKGVVCCVVLLLAGCGVGGRSGNTGPTSSGAAGGTAVPTNERGFVVTKLGEPACFGGGRDCAGGVTFIIDQIDVDPQCAAIGSQPENGHTLLLHLRVATGTDKDAIARADSVINPFSFVEVGKDGLTRPATFGICADPSANQLPTSYGPNQLYAGVIDLEVPKASGTLALQTMFPDLDGHRGWEWTYPVRQ